MRYLGNKTKLMETIDGFLVQKNLKEKGLVFCDAFSGTGSVSDFFSDTFEIISNDNLYFPSIMVESKLNKKNVSFEKLGFCPFHYFNNIKETQAGFVTNNYSPAGEAGRMYFSEENARIIDTIRIELENWFDDGKINLLEKKYLISCLIESVSKVANVAGVYGAYLKKWDSRALKKMKFIDIETIGSPSYDFEHKSYNKSVLELLDDCNVSGDILYLDPPYTKNKYTTQYHVLETIAKFDEPFVKGITGARDMSSYSHDFTNEYSAMSSFEKIVRNSNFKYIILSYNSDGLMSEDFIKNTMCRYGKPETFELLKIPYARYKNHKSVDNEKHYESLFFIEKKDSDYNIASPLNYQGGKHDMIDFIRENMPKKFDCFYDLFGGGFNVGANLSNNNVIYNDINFKVKELLSFFYTVETDVLLKKFNDIRKKYNLKKTEKEPYLKLREFYNKQKNKKEEILFMLMMYGFQQQFRFNSKYEYNNPIGQSSYNGKVAEKVTSFSNKIKEKNVKFYSEDYEFFEKEIKQDDFVYIDPPYLITLGSYNDGKRGFNGWNKEEELRLLNFLERLNKKGVKFMLSNVIEHKEKKNEILINWIEENGFKLIKRERLTRGRQEILVMNY